MLRMTTLDHNVCVVGNFVKIFYTYFMSLCILPSPIFCVKNKEFCGYTSYNNNENNCDTINQYGILIIHWKSCFINNGVTISFLTGSTFLNVFLQNLLLKHVSSIKNQGLLIKF